MTDRKIEQRNGHGFGWQQLLANSIEIFISHEKKSDLSRPKFYEAYFLTLELSQCRKSGSMFSSSEQVAARSDCRRLFKHPVFVLAPPTRASRAGERPQGLGR